MKTIITNLYTKGPQIISRLGTTASKAAEAIENGHKVEADLDNGVIYDLTTGKEYKTQPFPEFIQKIIQNGGLIESIKKGELN